MRCIICGKKYWCKSSNFCTPCYAEKERLLWAAVNDREEYERLDAYYANLEKK